MTRHLVLAISCAAALLAGAACRRGPAEDDVQAEEKGTLEVLGEVAEAEYDPPAHGKLTEEQIERYLEVKQRAKGGEEGGADDSAFANLEAAQELGHNPKEFYWVDERVKEALLSELSRILEAQLAEGRDEYVQLLERQREALGDPGQRAEIDRRIAEMRGKAAAPTQPLTEALLHNIALVAKHRDRIRAVQSAEERFATGEGEERPAGPPTTAAPPQP
ncbi:MAG TPA: hypothetical protein VF121_03170 [Thermoanaerobaculia bacterium]|nr:hypothetical protein [Thermoanaerobaculia bacterium]